MRIHFLVLVFIILSSFIASANPQAIDAHCGHTPMNRSDLKELTADFEEQLQNGETELLMANDLPRIQYFKAPTKWNWRQSLCKLEAVAAILTEKYRKEIGAYIAKDGSLWFSQGSPDHTLVPDVEEGTLFRNGKYSYNQIFHTHPKNGEGGTRPSGSDEEGLKENSSQNSSIISMNGYIRTFSIENNIVIGVLPARKLLTEKIDYKDPITNNRINSQAAVYDELQALLQYYDFTRNDPRSEEIRLKIIDNLRILKEMSIGILKFNHTSLPDDINVEFENAFQKVDSPNNTR